MPRTRNNEVNKLKILNKLNSEQNKYLHSLLSNRLKNKEFYKIRKTFNTKLYDNIFVHVENKAAQKGVKPFNYTSILCELINLYNNDNNNALALSITKILPDSEIYSLTRDLIELINSIIIETEEVFKIQNIIEENNILSKSKFRIEFIHDVYYELIDKKLELPTEQLVLMKLRSTELKKLKNVIDKPEFQYKLVNSIAKLINSLSKAKKKLKRDVDPIKFSSGTKFNKKVYEKAVRLIDLHNKLVDDWALANGKNIDKNKKLDELGFV